MPQTLTPRAMPNYFLKFSGLLHEDPSTYIERYIEVMLANVIAEDTYKLVWFSTTQEGVVYEWYRSTMRGCLGIRRHCRRHSYNNLDWK